MAAIVLSLLAILVYAGAYLAQPSSPTKLVLTLYDQPLELSGRGNLTTQENYAAELPAQNADGSFRVSPAFRFRIESHGRNPGTLDTSIDVDFEGRITPVFLNHFALNNGSFERTIASEPFSLQCPCPARPIRFVVNFSLDNPAGEEYAYVFTPVRALAYVTFPDHDHDGIRDDAQWIRGVPQYVPSLLLGLGAAGFLVLGSKRAKP